MRLFRHHGASLIDMEVTGKTTVEHILRMLRTEHHIESHACKLIRRNSVLDKKQPLIQGIEQDDEIYVVHEVKRRRITDSEPVRNEDVGNGKGSELHG